MARYRWFESIFLQRGVRNEPCVGVQQGLERSRTKFSIDGAAMCVETARRYDKIAPEAPHALHMPSHIYSILGMWEDSVHSNVSARKAAEDYWAKNSPGKAAPSLPHFFDFMVTADLQMAKDAEAKQLVDASTGLFNFPYPSLAIDTALAAIPAPYALDRGQWEDAAHLAVRDSQFPAAQSITYFASRKIDIVFYGSKDGGRHAEGRHKDLCRVHHRAVYRQQAAWVGIAAIMREATTRFEGVRALRRQLASLQSAADRTDTTNSRP